MRGIICEVFPENAVHVRRSHFFDRRNIVIGRGTALHGKRLGPDRSEPGNGVGLKFSVRDLLALCRLDQVGRNPVLRIIGQDILYCSDQCGPVPFGGKCRCGVAERCFGKRPSVEPGKERLAFGDQRVEVPPLAVQNIGQDLPGCIVRAVVAGQPESHYGKPIGKVGIELDRSRLERLKVDVRARR